MIKKRGSAHHRAPVGFCYLILSCHSCSRRSQTSEYHPSATFSYPPFNLFISRDLLIRAAVIGIAHSAKPITNVVSVCISGVIVVSLVCVNGSLRKGARLVTEPLGDSVSVRVSPQELSSELFHVTLSPLWREIAKRYLAVDRYIIGRCCYLW